MQTTGGKVVLGIDPGIADTGVGVVRVGKNGRLECLYYASIKTSSKEALADRLIQLHDQIEVVIKKYKPDVSAIEQLFFCKNVKTALVVGQARGVALYTLKKSRLPIAEFTPLQVKQAVSTYGKADKKQVQRMVKMLLNLKELPQPDDAADALAIAICGANYRHE